MNGPLLDRDLDLQWLDEALRVARSKQAVDPARVVLREHLSDVGLGDAALTKTLTALTRTWLKPAAAGDRGTLWALDFADRSTDWRTLHLGALLATQAFFRRHLEACGLEFRGHEEINTVDLRRRMRAALGSRRSVDIATQRGVKTLRSLGLLVGEPSSSTSTCGQLLVEETDLAMWLVRCLLVGREAESIGVDDLAHAPELFAVTLPRAFPRTAAGVTRHAEGVGRVVLALDPMPR